MVHLSEACESGECVSQSAPAYSVFPTWKADSELLKTEPASLLAPSCHSAHSTTLTGFQSSIFVFRVFFFKALTDLTSTEDII